MAINKTSRSFPASACFGFDSMEEDNHLCVHFILSMLFFLSLFCSASASLFLSLLSSNANLSRSRLSRADISHCHNDRALMKQFSFTYKKPKSSVYKWHGSHFSFLTNVLCFCGDWRFTFYMKSEWYTTGAMGDGFVRFFLYYFFVSIRVKT